MDALGAPSASGASPFSVAHRPSSALSSASPTGGLENHEQHDADCEPDEAERLRGHLRVDHHEQPG